jgi:hypothetical protein
LPVLSTDRPQPRPLQEHRHGGPPARRRLTPASLAIWSRTWAFVGRGIGSGAQLDDVADRS